MNFDNDENSSPSFSCITWQELQLRQLLLSEGIPFEFQKVFSLPDCQYIADFFLPNKTILECSSTNMLKFQIPLRKKAIHLENKSANLKKQHPSLTIWVLFETYRPILEPFTHTLIRLMPSVDYVFFSQEELLEHLRKNFLLLNKHLEVIS